MFEYIFYFHVPLSLFRKKTSYWIGCVIRSKNQKQKTQANSNDDDNNKIRIFVDRDFPFISEFLAVGNSTALPLLPRFSFFFSLMRWVSLAEIRTQNGDTSHVYAETAREKSLTPAGKAFRSLSLTFSTSDLQCDEQLQQLVERR